MQQPPGNSIIHGRVTLLFLLHLFLLLPPLLRNMPCNCSISCISNFPGTNPSVSLLHSLFMSTRRLLDCILQAGQTQKGAFSILHRGKFKKVRRWQASLASCLVFVYSYLRIRICVFAFVYSHLCICICVFDLGDPGWLTVNWPAVTHCMYSSVP